MNIYIGADHRGFRLKEEIKRFLSEQGYQVTDMGNTRLEATDDYPDFVGAAAGEVSRNYENAKGIVICGSGIGASVVANRFPHVRAGLAFTPDQAFDGRNDDDTNMLVLGANYLDKDAALKIVSVWLGTPFSGEERHARRIGKIEAME